MKSIRRNLIVGLSLAITAGAGHNSAVAGPPQAENSVKAAFVYNFAKLTAFPADSGPLVVGIIGSGPTADAIERVLDGKDAGGRKIAVKKISEGDAKSVQIAFVAGTGGAPKVGAGVLTVGEAPGFASSGGAIGFVVDGGKVRFEINMGVVKKAGLKIDDKIVGLGKAVG